jgi:phosphate transport system substrate-binding protein
VRSIFLGQITNWKELGGPDRKINLFAGESTTGTLAFFQEAVLHGEEPYPFEGKNNTHSLLK